MLPSIKTIMYGGGRQFDKMKFNPRYKTIKGYMFNFELKNKDKPYDVKSEEYNDFRHYVIQWHPTGSSYICDKKGKDDDFNWGEQMSFSSETFRNDYVGAGTTDTYNYSFLILDETHLQVVQRSAAGVETTLALTTDYTVTGVGVDSGGTITLTAGNLASGVALTIKRKLPITQETDIRNQGEFFPETHENEFDRGKMVSGQQQDDIDRSIRLPVTISSSAFDPELPGTMTLPASAGKVPAINADSDAFELKSASELLAAAVGGFEATGSQAILDSQTNTNLTGFTISNADYVGMLVLFNWERSTNGGMTLWRFQYVNSAWVAKEIIYNQNTAHGLSFDINSTQVRYSSDSSGSGTLRWRALRIEA